ncbi:Hypothetical predicted protein [Olea europaea subsp. europaea]|uniref:Uncharacterized protein n=1 Tax=Olea europaea subsp. europaea TaxID=158383 RepID=A0A8S0SNY2_OLEEU|nr:Hypothetical predicted protein [Olea europaea subsp. europaea]
MASLSAYTTPFLERLPSTGIFKGNMEWSMGDLTFLAHAMALHCLLLARRGEGNMKAITLVH